MVFKDGVRANNYQPTKPLVVEIANSGDVDDEILEVITEGDKKPDILTPQRIHSTVSLVSCHSCRVVGIWPSGKLPFDSQKIAKNLTFFSKKLTKIVICWK